MDRWLSGSEHTRPVLPEDLSLVSTTHVVAHDPTTACRLCGMYSATPTLSEQLNAHFERQLAIKFISVYLPPCLEDS